MLVQATDWLSDCHVQSTGSGYGGSTLNKPGCIQRSEGPERVVR